MADSGAISNVASAARFGMNPTPLGAAGLGIGVASSMLGGKGEKGNAFVPQFRGGVGGAPLQVRLGTQDKTWIPATQNMFGTAQQARQQAANVWNPQNLTPEQKLIAAHQAVDPYARFKTQNQPNPLYAAADTVFKSSMYNSRLGDYLRANPGAAAGLASLRR